MSNSEICPTATATKTAIGSYYKMLGGSPHTSSGVVEDAKYASLTEGPQSAMFLPIPHGKTSSIAFTKRQVE